MTRSPKEESLNTFTARAKSYDGETDWVTSETLIDPLVPHTTDNVNFSPPYWFLDVCAGTGGVAKRAAELGWTVVAIDQNIPMLDKLVNNSILRVFSDAETVNMAPRSFDVVSMRQALHYFDPALMIRQLLELSKNELRLGHITMFHEEDRPIWEAYFKIASPGRKRIFAPNDIARSIQDVGGIVVSEIVLESVEQLAGPIYHLGPQTVERLEKMFLDAPAKFRDRYSLIRNSAGGIDMRLRWEFHVVRPETLA